MRSKKINFVCLMLVFVTLPIITILMFHHITLCETISSMDSGAFGGEAKIITTDKNTDFETLYYSFDKSGGRYTVYSDFDNDDGSTVREMCFNGRYVNFPMQSGRFFTSSDFEKKADIAVVGKDRKNDVKHKNGNDYISLQGTDYKVVGVLGYDCNTLFDSYIFIGGNTTSKHFLNNIYTVDVFDSNSDNFMEQAFSNLKSCGINAEQTSSSLSFADTFLPRILYGRIFILIFALDLLCLVLLSVQWINGQKQTYCIMRLLGADNLRIVLNLGGKYFLLLLFSFVVGVGYCLLFYSSYMYNLLCGYALFVPFAIIFLLVSALSVLKTSVAEAIK